MNELKSVWIEDDSEKKEKEKENENKAFHEKSSQSEETMMTLQDFRDIEGYYIQQVLDIDWHWPVKFF